MGALRCTVNMRKARRIFFHKQRVKRECYFVYHFIAEESNSIKEIESGF